MFCRRTAAFVVVLAAFGAACNDDGRVLAPAPPTTNPSVPATTPDGLPTFRVSSADLVDGAAIDIDHTCDGVDAPPTLAITGVPEGAVELAVVVTDVDAADFVHWVVAGLPHDTLRIDGLDLPEGAVEARNGFGELGWQGPCPPEGDGVHRYAFAVHALPERTGLAPDLAGPQAVEIVRSASVAVSDLVVTYERPQA